MLDISHNCWYGSYGTFHRWRMEIARSLGYECVEDDDGDGPTFLMPWSELGYDRPQGKYIPTDIVLGEWLSHDPPNPISVLLGHGDCDGVIKKEHAGPLADALEGLELHEKWRGITDRFVAGLRDAASKQEDVTFG